MLDSIFELPGVTAYSAGSIEVEKSSLIDTCFFIKSNYENIWLRDISFSQNAENCNVEYVFEFVEYALTLFLVTKFDIHDTGPSISQFWRNATIFEQEIYNNYSFSFSNTEENSFLNKREDLIHTSFKNRDSFLGEEFPDTVYLKNKNEQTYASLVKRGICRVNLEDQLVGKSFSETINIIEDGFLDKNILWSSLFCLSVESGLGLEVPGRGKAIRMIFWELSRINDHLSAFSSIAYLGQDKSLYHLAQVQRMRIKILLSGAIKTPYLTNGIVVGGVKNDIENSWPSEVITELKSILKIISNYYKNIFQKSEYKKILNQTIMTKKTVELLSLSGGLARSCGVNLDKRRSNPIYFYKDVDFSVPLKTNGTGFDILSIRFEEIIESISIINQILDNLPLGDVQSAYKSTGLICSGGASLEGSNGYSSIRLALDEQSSKSIVKRIKLQSPSVVNLGFFEKYLQPMSEKKLNTVWSLLQISMQEVEK